MSRDTDVEPEINIAEMLIFGGTMTDKREIPTKLERGLNFPYCQLRQLETNKA